MFTHYQPNEDRPLPGPVNRRRGYGVFCWWPERGEAWIHPYDVGIVRHLVPGQRVFRREELDGRYQLISYGKIAFRARSSLWLRVEHEGFDIGDMVQVKSHLGRNLSFVGQIQDMYWDPQKKRIEYHVGRANQRQPRPYFVDELERVEALPATAIQAEPGQR